MIGDYREHVIFQDPGAPIPDGVGGWSEEWADLSPAAWRVQIEPSPINDQERTAAGGTVVAVTPTVVVRGWRHPGVSTSTRMVWGSRTFAITGVRAADPQRRVMELTAVERKAP
jgi:head-tail adaptor